MNSQVLVKQLTVYRQDKGFTPIKAWLHYKILPKHISDGPTVCPTLWFVKLWFVTITGVIRVDYETMLEMLDCLKIFSTFQTHSGFSCLRMVNLTETSSTAVQFTSCIGQTPRMCQPLYKDCLSETEELLDLISDILHSRRICVEQMWRGEKW